LFRADTRMDTGIDTHLSGDTFGMGEKETVPIIFQVALKITCQNSKPCYA
jgi:hypothetical protein